VNSKVQEEWLNRGVRFTSIDIAVLIYEYRYCCTDLRVSILLYWFPAPLTSNKDDQELTACLQVSNFLVHLNICTVLHLPLIQFKILFEL